MLNIAGCIFYFPKLLLVETSLVPHGRLGSVAEVQRLSADQLKKIIVPGRNRSSTDGINQASYAAYQAPAKCGRNAVQRQIS